MKTVLTVLLTLSLLILLAACSENPDTGCSDPTGSDGTTASIATSSQSTTVATTTAAATITADAAKAIAFEHADIAEPDASRLIVEYERDDGVPSYEIEFYADGVKYEYDIHAESGQVLKYEKEQNLTGQGTTTGTTAGIAPAPTLTADEAKAIAFEHAEVNEADVYDLSVEFDRDGGVPTYEIDFEADGFDYEYDIHADSGEILYSERDRDDR